jgi:hypothetical protein
MMALQIYELHMPDDGEDHSDGIAIVDTVTGEPLPISLNAFWDAEEAQACLDWLEWGGGDWRTNSRVLDGRIREWCVKVRHLTKCDTCHARLKPGHASALCEDCAEEAVA